MIRLSAFSAVLAASISAGPAAADDNNWRVAAAAAKCIQSSISQYLQSSTENVLIIVVADCDKTASALAILEDTAVPNPSTAPDGGDDPVVIYSRQELECLRDVSFKTENDYALMPKKPRC